jgi:acyl-CoA synthetase (NDP forming)
MEKFFYPKSVAVVGVSENPINLARGIVANLLEFGYQGKIYPVGPRGGWIFGLRILSHLEDLPEPVDLAAILIPARYVPQVVADCGKLGIARVVVESGGFSELGEPGQALEEEIRSLLKKYNLRLVGPNGLGLVNLEIGLALPFSHLRPKPRRGNLSIISQSGGVGLHLLAWMGREGLGLNKFLSLGNKLDVAENETLAYFLQDPGTQAIYLYLEGMTNGAELLALGRQAGKPIFLDHANVGPETAGIARSHTASLATDEQVLEAACRQGGILRIRSQAEFLVGAKLAAQPLVRGPRVVVLSRSGGEAVISAYACRQWGFVLPPLSPKLAQLLEQRSRAGVIKPTNPIDLGDIFDFAVYSELMAAICRDPEVDAVLLNYGPIAESERREARQHVRLLVELARQYGKPLAIAVVCTLDEEEFFVETLGLPVFHFPGEAVRSLAYSRFFGQRAETPGSDMPRSRAQGKKIAAILAQAPGADFLALPQALALTAALGIDVPPWQAAASREEAVAAAERLGYPVALKLAAPSLVHKTEAGAVLLNLTEAGAVTAGFARLAEIVRDHLPPGEPWQVLVMTMVSGGQEVLMGARRDQAFGPVLAFGAGGVATEILEDVALRVAPLNPAEARRQIAETRIGRILAGIRGQPPADLEALSQALSDLSQLMLDFPQITEVDLNPVRVFPGQPGLLALDARIKVG